MVRAAFGGMKCDTEMLWGYAGYWASRLMGLSAGPPDAGGGGGCGAAAAAGGMGGGKEGAVGGEGAAGDPGGMKDQEGKMATAAAPSDQQQQQQPQQQQSSPAANGGDHQPGGGDGGATPWLPFLESCYGSLGLQPPRITLVAPLRRWVARLHSQHGGGYTLNTFDYMTLLCHV
jgi:hypothetical protein